jgi:uroporphyrinogen III methyltransferase/synthase
VLAYPTIATEEDHRPEVWESLRAISADKQWLVLTNENSVRYFLDQWFVEVGDIRRLKDYRIAALGGGTIRALAKNHIVADFVPSVSSTKALTAEMTQKLQLAGAAVVRVRGNYGGDSVEESLRAAGAIVLPLPVYRSFPVKWPPEAKDKLFSHPPDVIVFTSGSAVSGLAENLGEGELETLTDGATVVSVGPSTSRIIESYGMTVGLESAESTIPSILDGLLDRHRETPLHRTR